jgi:iron complex outermembrane receptor protein
MMPLLDSGVIDPFANDSSAAALAAAAGDTFVGQDYSTRTSITSLNGSASRKIFDLPGGALSAAVGAEVRRETFDYNPSTVIQTGDVAGLGGSSFPQSSARDVESAFVEINAPLIEGLDADAAVRFDNYQSIGHTVNPKGSIRWQAEPWLLFRTSAGSGFRAPSLTDLYAAQASSVTSNGTRDPIQCATFNANNPACSFQFTTVTGGNPNLKPETSQTITLGTVIEPVKNLTLDLDSFWIYLQNQIAVGGLSYAYILQNAQTATEYANFVTRNAAGQIVSINQENANLFKAETSGLDIDIKYAFDLGGAGRIRLIGDGTYYYRFVTQNPDGSWTSQVDEGTTNAPGFVSRFRYTATAIYDLGPWEGSLTDNFQKQYHDSASSITDVSREVSAYETLDAQLAFTGITGLKVSLGARNLFDKAPPYTNYGGVANNFIGGYDISYADPRGRFVYVNLSYKVR